MAQCSNTTTASWMLSQKLESSSGVFYGLRFIESGVELERSIQIVAFISQLNTWFLAPEDVRTNGDEAMLRNAIEIFSNC